MKKTVKKSLAILLCALIMLSALPVQALAAEAGDVISDTSVSLQEDATGNDSSQPEA